MRPLGRCESRPIAQPSPIHGQPAGKRWRARCPTGHLGTARRAGPGPGGLFALRRGRGLCRRPSCRFRAMDDGTTQLLVSHLVRLHRLPQHRLMAVPGEGGFADSIVERDCVPHTWPISGTTRRRPRRSTRRQATVLDPENAPPLMVRASLVTAAHQLGRCASPSPNRLLPRHRARPHASAPPQGPARSAR